MAETNAPTHIKDLLGRIVAYARDRGQQVVPHRHNYLFQLAIEPDDELQPCGVVVYDAELGDVSVRFFDGGASGTMSAGLEKGVWVLDSAHVMPVGSFGYCESDRGDQKVVVEAATSALRTLVALLDDEHGTTKPT